MSDPAPMAAPASDIAALIERLKAKAWASARYKVRAKSPARVEDHVCWEAVAALAAQQAEIERLRAPKMWCLSCGTITRDGGCNCTRSHPEAQKLVNYEEELRQWAAALESALAARDETIRGLREALAPFAGYLNRAAFDLDDNGNPLPDEHGMGWIYLNVGHFRAARAALNSTEPTDG